MRVDLSRKAKRVRKGTKEKTYKFNGVNELPEF